MHLVLSQVRKTVAYYRGEDKFLHPDYHSPVDEFDVIRIEGVIRFYQAYQGLYITFDTMENAMAAHQKTDWVHDDTQPHVTLYARFSWGQGCILIGEKAYMNWRVEQP